tara:strand:- start:516 stop:2543 length:2028 start_codon:yes stop_codon:yes gene_type:complete
MNQSNKKLESAKTRQLKKYIILTLITIALLSLLAIFLIYSRGTRIDVSPLEANKSAKINVIDRFGFSISDVVYSISSNPVIKVSSPGFKDTTVTIDSLYLGKNFPLELSELPGQIIVNLLGNKDNVSNTSWRINGHDVAYSATLDQELEAGTYTINIDNPFFLPKELTVKIKRNQKTKIQTELQPVNGRINVSSSPIGANVFLNDRYIGKTPVDNRQKGGVYSLRITADNFIDLIDKFEITHIESNLKRSYRLARIKAKIIPKLSPKGGRLIVNGSLSRGPIFLSTNVEHRLTYIKDGYYPITKKIKFSSDEDKEISFQLEKEFGRVIISSSPPADIWINNKIYSNNPITVSLPAITQNIVFKKEGYRSVTKTVNPTAKFSQKLSVKLITEYQARLQEAPREMTNKAGIKLKLFIKPGVFEMGAPRSQKGQRANEFQKRINLSKSFYASIFEITNSQYGKFKPSLRKSLGADNEPVISIDWNEAASFCNWLSKNEGLQDFYKIENKRVIGFNKNTDGYRLLSEAEWEWLSRKAGKTKQTIFSWGDEIIIPPNTANISDESAKAEMRFYMPNYNDGYMGIAPVGSFNKEPSGLYDISGNVSEWVHDFYSVIPPIGDEILMNPLGEERGQLHVVKGANFRSGSITMLRPSFREGLMNTGRDDVGFRVGRYLYGGKNE